MKKSWKRSLSLFLSAVLAGSLLPAAALAEEAAPQPLADTPEYEYVEDTDDVDSGAVYAILYETSNGSLLYHNGSGSNVDQIGGSVTDGMLTSVDSSANWTIENVLWTAVQTENGYTLQNKDTGYYLNLSSANTTRAQVSAEPSEVTITLNGGQYTITNGALALCHNVTGHYYTAESEAASLRFFKQTEVTDPVDPEPEEPATGAPEIPGYTQYTEEALDPSKYYLIVTEDSDGNLYALYLNQAGTQVSSGGLTGANGACTATLTVAGDSVSAAYLADGTALEMDDLRITVNSSGEGYTFRSGDLGLTLSSNMFSADYTNLAVSVSDGIYTIQNTSAGRLLSFNRVGDSLSDYPGETYITDFWGPKAATGFSIYLYTQDAASVPVDKSQLQSLVASVSELEETDYTTGSWAALQKALASAQVVLDDSNATQSEVNAARDALTSAIAALEYVVAPPAGLPTTTLYQKAAGPIQAGDIIAVVYEGTNSALYSSTKHTTTDQINASVDGDQLTNTPDTILWKVVAVDGGLALQNQNSGKYLDLTELTDGSAGGKAHISEVPVSLTFTETENGYLIQGSGHYLRHNDDTQSYKFFYSRCRGRFSYGHLPVHRSRGQ